jgi:hypothetical protein
MDHFYWGKQPRATRFLKKIPVFFPVNGNSPGDGFAADCIHRRLASKTSNKTPDIVGVFVFCPLIGAGDRGRIARGLIVLCSVDESP